MLIQVVSRAMEMLQSDNEVSLKNFQLTFNLTEMPDGGAATVSRD
jgi:hypothetical protein